MELLQNSKNIIKREKVTVQKVQDTEDMKRIPEERKKNYPSQHLLNVK